MTEKNPQQFDPVVRNVVNRWAYTQAYTTAFCCAVLVGGMTALVLAAVLAAIWVPLFFAAPIGGFFVGRKVLNRVYDSFVEE